MAGHEPHFRTANAQILAVAPATVEEAQRYLARAPLPFPVLADPECEVFARYGVASRATSLGQRPGLFVVDAEGVVQFAHIGRQQWEIPAEEAVLEQVRCLRCRLNV
ncbi:MAG: redoxin domain-containing protein [Dehalococcoidia bacterium]|nr:redoxin domain-containing protein [Dehalococcoidia bacterium]